MDRSCIIVDLDGTLANCEHRRHLVEAKNWLAFYEAMDQDGLNAWCSWIMELVIREGVEVVITSGRPEEYRERTVEWLKRFDQQYHALFMRPSKDYRTDFVVKQEILDTKILPQWRPIFAIDDRKQVADMWRRNGIVCLHCADGEF